MQMRCVYLGNKSIGSDPNQSLVDKTRFEVSGDSFVEGC